MIKSGGEWISSIELENVAMSHPQVRSFTLVPSSLTPSVHKCKLLALAPFRLQTSSLPTSLPPCLSYQVAMAAVIAMPHAKWDERPLLIVVPKPAPPSSSFSTSTSASASSGSPPSSLSPLTREALLQYFQGKVAKWWVPDDVVFVESIPLGATGKVLKTELRERFKGHK